MISRVAATAFAGISSPLKAARTGLSLGILLTLAGCNDLADNRGMQALSAETMQALAEKGVALDAPMLIRAFKKESELEVWKMRPDGAYVLVKSFPICRWSGQLGPKMHEGDRQSPEGFYAITPAQMNPHSAYYLSFNVGYPNAYDRAHGATGGSVMVHGVCSSAGCYSMTDQQIGEIYALAREAFSGGQRSIQMQAYPFHMDAQNLAKYRLDPNMPFWKEIKKGNDHFEVTKRDVPVGVCNRHYVFGGKPGNGEAFDAEGACPALKTDPNVEALVAQREAADEALVADLVAKGARPVRLVYQDGAQHPAFAHRIAEVSRPDALTPPIELALDDPNAKVSHKARTANTSVALVMAKAQADKDAQQLALAEAQKAQTSPVVDLTANTLAAARAHGANIATMISSFGHDEPKLDAAAPVAIAAVTEVPRSQPVAKLQLSDTGKAKPKKPVVKTTATDKPAPAKPAAPHVDKQKVASVMPRIPLPAGSPPLNYNGAALR